MDQESWKRVDRFCAAGDAAVTALSLLAEGWCSERHSTSGAVSATVLQRSLGHVLLQEGEQEESRVHVLAPYTKNVNSIKRHVRTRIYFTSESHIHSLMNILRYENHDGRSLLSEAAREQLDGTREFDYLTQIVFRLYEMKNVRPTVVASVQSFCPEFRFC